jgi:hypothetical protein
MRASFKILIAAGVLSAASLAVSAPASAQSTSFGFRVGDVGIAYNDGYYDRDRRWHHWRSAREHDWYRAHYVRNYRGWRHDRDGDGIPNRYDRYNNNRYDRDRDGDGVPNRYDRRPDNPYR